MLRLAEEQERQGEDEECLLTLQHLIDAEPIYERAVRQLMRTHWRLGEGGQALLVYQRLLRALEEEVAAPPAPETRALADTIRCGAAPPLPEAKV
jgi:DNA-binding SARP family transcriptional activator